MPALKYLSKCIFTASGVHLRNATIRLSSQKRWWSGAPRRSAVYSEHELGMITRRRLLRLTEYGLLSLGILSSAFFVAAMVDRGFYSQLALRNSGFDGPALTAPAKQVQNGPVDFSLWSPKRVQLFLETIATDKPIAVLRIQKLNLRVPVFSGTTEVVLNRGAGWIPGTARPGESGNVGIAGHRDGFFRALKDIKIGDPVELFTAAGKSEYAVEQIEIVNPQNVAVLRRPPCIFDHARNLLPLLFRG